MSKEIKLTRNKFAIVDDDNYKWLTQYKWHYTTRGYVARRRKNNEQPGSYLIFMHRFILDTHNKNSLLITDHINSNKLDNRKSNLRVVDNATNIQKSKQFSHNTSGYRGVSFNKEKKLYETYIGTKNRIRIGYFINPAIAARSYDYYARKMYGNNATLNFPDEVIAELPQEDKILQRNNTSGYRGVSYRKTTGKWLAEIMINKERIRIGEFDTAIEGAQAYNDVAVQYLGNKAKLNILSNS